MAMLYILLAIIHLSMKGTYCTDKVIPTIPGRTNIALHKPANQTGAFQDMTADMAVDGLRDSCAHPNADYFEPASWVVDLGMSYRVLRIIIFNTDDYAGHLRMTQFVISVGLRLDSMQDCGPAYDGVVGPGANFTVPCDLIGRYVKMRRVDGKEIHLFTLCELQVYGYLSTDESLDGGVQVRSVTHNSVTLTWKQNIDVTETTKPETSYEIWSARRLSAVYTLLRGPSVEYVHNSTLAYGEVKPLAYNTQYDFVVRVLLNETLQYDLDYPVVTAKTRCIDPAPPNNVLLIPSTSDAETATVSIAYDRLDPKSSGCDRFTNVWADYKIKNDTTWTRTSLQLDATSHTLVPPAGRGTYEIHLETQNNEGFVSSTGIFTVIVLGLPVENDTTMTAVAIHNHTLYFAIISALSIVIVILVIVASICVCFYKRRLEKCGTGAKRPKTRADEKHLSLISIGRCSTPPGAVKENVIPARAPGVNAQKSIISTGQYITPPGLQSESNSSADEYKVTASASTNELTSPIVTREARDSNVLPIVTGNRPQFVNYKRHPSIGTGEYLTPSDMITSAETPSIGTGEYLTPSDMITSAETPIRNSDNGHYPLQLSIPEIPNPERNSVSGDNVAAADVRQVDGYLVPLRSPGTTSGEYNTIRDSSVVQFPDDEAGVQSPTSGSYEEILSASSPDVERIGNNLPPNAQYQELVEKVSHNTVAGPYTQLAAFWNAVSTDN